MARHGQLILAAALLGACRDKSTPLVEAAVPFQRCENPNAMPFDRRIEEARADRVRETRRLMGILAPASDVIVSVGRLPSCAWPPDVNERVAIAEKAFRTKAGDEAITARTVGCEEEKQLLVGFELRKGYFADVLSATFKVDATKATYVGPGLARAHVDLDGDGKRDVVWSIPVITETMDFHFTRQHFEVRFAAGRTLKTTPEWEEPRAAVLGLRDDSGGVPELTKDFVLLVGGSYGLGRDGGIAERLRWNGKELTQIPRIEADDFETRIDNLRHADEALDFAKLKPELDRCSKIIAADASCLPIREQARAQLETGGFSRAEAEAMLRDHLGWPCPMK